MCGTFYNFGRWQRSNRRGWPTVACATLLGLVLALYAIAPTSPESAASDGTTFSPAALAEARATGKPVFVYFTADWCLSCKANEAGAIERAAVQTAFDTAGVVQLGGAWKGGEPEVGQRSGWGRGCS